MAFQFNVSCTGLGREDEGKGERNSSRVGRGTKEGRNNKVDTYSPAQKLDEMAVPNTKRMVCKDNSRLKRPSCFIVFVGDDVIVPKKSLFSYCDLRFNRRDFSSVSVRT
jgi:hypothetical protein